MSIRTNSTIIVITFQSSYPPPIYFLISIQWQTAEHYSGSTQSTFVFHYHFSYVFAGEGSASLFPASSYAFLIVVFLATVQGISSRKEGGFSKRGRSLTPASGVGTTAVVLATARYYCSVLRPWSGTTALGAGISRVLPPRVYRPLSALT